MRIFFIPCACLGTWVLLCFFLGHGARAYRSNLASGLGQYSTHSSRIACKLGVEHVRIFARAPVSGDEKIVLLNVWLKRISNQPATQNIHDGGTGPGHDRGPSFMLPTQTPAVEGFAWAEDLARINQSRWGLLDSPVDMYDWQPRLWLERADGNATVATLHPAMWTQHGETKRARMAGIRPAFFFFPLGPGNASSRCFKIYESSMPDYKAPVCLQLSSANLCHRLAPPSRFIPASPALWTAMVPFRSMGVEGPRWAEHMRLSANRIHNYLSYYRALGATGLLLYADRLTAEGLEPHVRELLRAGTLVLVAWDNIERMQYNYDQALVYSHAALGLSSCGTNLWLQATDVDELLYNAYGKLWPDMFDCLLRTSKDLSPGLFRFRRIDVTSTRVRPADEAALWSGKVAAEVAAHPALLYDKVARRVHDNNVGKYIACPARRLVAVFTHTALPVHGGYHEGNTSCTFILHLPNYWSQRTWGEASEYDPVRLRMGYLLPMHPRAADT